MTALEKSFLDICDKHGLTALQITGRPGGRFTACAHWEGFSSDGNSCEHGFGDCLQEAIHKCLEAAGKKRAPAPFYPQLDQDEPLQTGEAA